MRFALRFESFWECRGGKSPPAIFSGKFHLPLQSFTRETKKKEMANFAIHIASGALIPSRVKAFFKVTWVALTSASLAALSSTSSPRTLQRS
jgi:hypothetical protein